MSHKDAQALRRLCTPQTKPYNLKYPHKHRKWRVQKKWFNRYGRKAIIGGILRAEPKDGGKPLCFKITDVKMNKAGRHKVSYSYFSNEYIPKN